LAAANHALELAERATGARPVRSLITEQNRKNGGLPDRKVDDPVLSGRKETGQPPKLRLIASPGHGIGQCTLPELRATAGTLVGPGHVVQVTGSIAALFAVTAGAWGSQDWGALAGLQNAGYLAAAQTGLPLERCVVVPDLGEEPLPVLAALIDACSVVVLGQNLPPPMAADRRRLEARLRHQQGNLITAGHWSGAQLCLEANLAEHQPLGQSDGPLGAGVWNVQWSGPLARRMALQAHQAAPAEALGAPPAAMAIAGSMPAATAPYAVGAG